MARDMKYSISGRMKISAGFMAQKLAEANCPYLKVGERVPNFRTEEEETGQIKFA